MTVWLCPACGRVTSQPDTTETVYCFNELEHDRGKTIIMKRQETDE